MLIPKQQSQLGVLNSRGSLIAIGASSSFPVILIEVTGALGILVAERSCPDWTLERVLYFRLLMDQPYARFFETVELLNFEGFSVAQTKCSEALFFEPSTIPYSIRNISKNQYEQLVDDIIAYRVDRAEYEISHMFANEEGFSLDAKGHLKAPANYANAMDQFFSKYKFVEPHEPKWKKGKRIILKNQ
jgi:hypothetical protein